MARTRALWIVPLALAGCLSRPAFRERLLATIPEGVDVVVPIAFSRDGRQVAWVERSPEGCRAVRGEWKGKPYKVL